LALFYVSFQIDVFAEIYLINLLKHPAFIKYKIEAWLFPAAKDGINMETELLINIKRENKAALFLKVIGEQGK